MNIRYIVAVFLLVHFSYSQPSNNNNNNNNNNDNTSSNSNSGKKITIDLRENQNISSKDKKFIGTEIVVTSASELEEKDLRYEANDISINAPSVKLSDSSFFQKTAKEPDTSKIAIKATTGEMSLERCNFIAKQVTFEAMKKMTLTGDSMPSIDPISSKGTVQNSITSKVVSIRSPKITVTDIFADSVKQEHRERFKKKSSQKQRERSAFDIRTSNLVIKNSTLGAITIAPLSNDQEQVSFEQLQLLQSKCVNNNNAAQPAEKAENENPAVSGESKRVEQRPSITIDIRDSKIQGISLFGGICTLNIHGKTKLGSIMEVNSEVTVNDQRSVKKKAQVKSCILQ